MLRVLTYDETGWDSEERRTTILSRELKALEVDVTEWNDGVSTEEPGGSILVLAHSVEPSTDERVKLLGIAESGGCIVFYSQGEMAEKEEVRGEGKVFSMRWPELQQAIAILPPHFDLNDFGAAVDTVRRRSLLSAVVVLLWCITVPADRSEVQLRQAEWKRDRGKWLTLFDGYTRLDFLRAFGVTADAVLPADLAEAGRALEWLWPSVDQGHNPPPPDFAMALDQLERRFKVKS
jgi:hypothetical protein